MESLSAFWKNLLLLKLRLPTAEWSAEKLNTNYSQSSWKKCLYEFPLTMSVSYFHQIRQHSRIHLPIRDRSELLDRPWGIAGQQNCVFTSSITADDVKNRLSKYCVWGASWIMSEVCFLCTSISLKCICHCWHLGKAVRSGRTPLIKFFSWPRIFYQLIIWIAVIPLKNQWNTEFLLGSVIFFSHRKLSLFEQELLMGILLAYRRMWCYSRRQGATGRDQCSSLGFPCSQWRQKKYKRNGEALNFSIQLWNALWRNICMTDSGEARLLRLRLVCVNSWFFSWLPVTLCIGTTATEWGSGFIQKNPKGIEG